MDTKLIDPDLVVQLKKKKRAASPDGASDVYTLQKRTQNILKSDTVRKPL